MSLYVNPVAMFIFPGVIFTLLFGLLYSGILRKVAARMQSRIGPPVIQPIYDIIKLLGKKNIIPEQAKMGFTFWPIISLTSILIAGMLTPIAGMVGMDIDGGLIALLYFMVFSTLAVYMSGISSSNPYGIIGANRGITQMIGYELPFVVSLLTPFLFLKTLSPIVVNAAQLQPGALWFGMLFPFAAFAFFAAILAKAELPPFHIPDAHQEIVSGHLTEFNGARLAILELTHFSKIFILISLGVAIFLGGAEASVIGFAIFIVKSLAVLLVLTIIRIAFARVRIEHAVRILWIIGAIGIIDLIRAALS